MKTLLLSASVLMLGFGSSPILAQTQRIPEQVARHQVPTISLKVNQGVNLNLPDGVLAYKGWLDDGSMVQLDGDRPFEQGASILHLVAQRAGQTQLSLVTRDANQVEALYVFKLVTGSQGNSIVNISADPVGNANTATLNNNAKELQQGVYQAIERRLLVEHSELHQAITGAIAKVEQGMSIPQAATTSNLNPRTLEQLRQLGQFSDPLPSQNHQESLLVKVTESPTTNEPRNIEARLTALENRVEHLDQQVVMLDTQQTEFLAQLESLDQQQEIFAALLQQERLVAQAPATPELQTKVSPVSVNTIPATTSNTPEAKILDRHQLANAIARGLTTHPDTPYRSPLYLRYQTMIRSLRLGSTPTKAVQMSDLQLSHVKSVLEHAGISPETAGI